jgi:hypothetical protein
MKRKAVGAGMIGLAILLTSCEKELAGSGETVEVFFSVSTTGHGGGDVAARGAKDLKPETVMSPINDDYFLNMTLVPEADQETTFDASQLRAAKPFTDGQKIKFAAFNGSSQVTGSPAVYTYSILTGKFTPDGTPLGVEPGATVYRFVAYSYFGDPTETPDETGITWDKDLVWGYADKAIPNTYAGREVDITMDHKFSRVSVKIDAHEIATAMKDITNVQIIGGKKAGFSSLRDGILTGGADVGQAVSGFSGTNFIQTSNQYLFYPSPTQVTIEELTLTIAGDDIEFGPLTAKFTETLLGATNYTLVVDVKERRFAWSNIYWDVDHLTFDTTDKDHEGYQGVFFKYGSMVGVSPVGFSSTTPLYKPNGIATGNYATWAHIPYVPINTPIPEPDIAALTGDICKYISDGAYRLPVGGEFGSSAGDWVPVGNFGAVTTSQHDGSYDFIENSKTYAANNTLGAILPAGGCLSFSNGAVVLVGNDGYYWGNNQLNMYFRNSGAYPLNYFTHQDGTRYGFSIRCIKKLPGE